MISIREIFTNNLSLDDVLEQQSRLKHDSDIFKESAKPNESVKKEKKALTLKNAIIVLNGRQKVFTLRCLINGGGGRVLIFQFFSTPLELIKSPPVY